MEVVCPKCAKVFTHPLYPSKARQALDSHLGRKNPCDSSEYRIDRPVTFEVPDMTRLDLTGVYEEMRDNIHLRDKFRLSTIFRILLKRNKFATMPNVGTGQVMYKLAGHVMHASMGQFIKDFWVYVLVVQVGRMLAREWDGWAKFAALVERSAMLSLETTAAQVPHINRWYRSDQYRVLSSAIMGFFRNELTRSERAQIVTNLGAPSPVVPALDNAPAPP
jgi:hypothetical protein